MRISHASAIWRIAAVFLSGVLLSAYPAASQEVRLNEVLRSLFYTPQYVAVRTDAFTRAGIKVIGPKTTWGKQAPIAGWSILHCSQTATADLFCPNPQCPALI